jgi:hypothetical protein
MKNVALSKGAVRKESGVGSGQASDVAEAVTPDGHIDTRA